MEKFQPQPPARPGGQKDKFARIKEIVIEKLLAKYESIVAEAMQHKKEARGLALLEQAEKELNKMQKVKNAKTLSEISEFQEPEENVEQEGFAFSERQWDVLDEVFGDNNLMRVDLPDPAELTPEYFDRMFPKKQRMEDLKKGLVSFRRFWEWEAGEEFPGFKKWTKGQAFMNSMKREAEKLRQKGFALYAESIQKPNPKSGTQMYGTAEGIAGGFDGLAPIMSLCFGYGANRFGHSHDELTVSFSSKREKDFFISDRQKTYQSYEFKRNTLLSPLEFIRREIEERLRKKGLVMPGFEVMLEPALVFNRHTTEKQPSNSQTVTEEMTSTTLLNESGQYRGNYFTVGDKSKGGASQVDITSCASHGLTRGFRIAILLLKK